MTDRILDWKPQHDPRSRNYPVRTLIGPGRKRQSYTWGCLAWNDQGREGACVGFAWSHELAARPVVHPTSNETALGLYRRARQLDEWPGEEYDGTSVLAGAKAVQEIGGLTEYRWAFGLEDLRDAIATKGPAVLGIPWMTGMFDIDSSGYVRATWQVEGGHAILCRGVNVPGRYFVLRNSWGRDWGRDGDCRISFDDLGSLLANQGEACIPVRR